MALKSPRFASSTALQNAARSAPPIRRGASGQHVIAIQQAFIDLGFGMEISTKKTGKADGIFGGETESPSRRRARPFWPNLLPGRNAAERAGRRIHPA